MTRPHVKENALQGVFFASAGLLASALWTVLGWRAGLAGLGTVLLACWLQIRHAHRNRMTAERVAENTGRTRALVSTSRPSTP